jgi:starvation-inducible DNA-binding protein
VSTSRTDHPAVRSTLGDAAQAGVAARLQPLLVDLLDLSLTGKQLHWTVVGPQFRTLHEQLDELVVQYRTWSDQVAERLTSIGVAPDGRVQRVAGDSPADPAPEGWIETAEVVRVLARRLEDVATRTREALDGLGEHDLVSEGLVTEILEGLEMQLWMVSAQEA